MSKKLWFKRKTYGYGWTPNTWQGWLFTGIMVVVYTWLSIAVVPRSVPLFIAATAVWVLILLAVCFLKGPSPRWQWGEDKSES